MTLPPDVLLLWFAVGPEPSRATLGWWVVVSALVVLLGLLAIAAFLSKRDIPKSNSWRFLVGLGATTPYAPLLMTAVTVPLYLAADYGLDSRYHFRVVAYGLVASLLAWAVVASAISSRLSVAAAIPRLYKGLLPYVADLRSAVDQLDAAIPVGDRRRETATRLANELWQVEFLLRRNEDDEPPPPEGSGAFLLANWSADWRSGVAYLALFRRIHAIESDLLMICSPQALVSAAVEDYARLRDSQVPECDYWRIQLFWAVRRLGRNAELLLQPPPSGVTASGLAVTRADDAKTPADLGVRPGAPAGQQPPTANEDELPADAEGPRLSLTEVRFQLRLVRRVLTDYRDSKFAALVHKQSDARVTLIGSGFLVYFTLIIAIVLQVDWTRIAGATVLFLIAAIAGLAGRIIGPEKEAPDIEDYGLGVVRQVQTVVLSGIAGVLGIVITIYGLSLGMSSELFEATPTRPMAPALFDLFDLSEHPTYLLIAAAFGLTPRLLLNRLDEAADRIKGNIKSAEAN